MPIFTLSHLLRLKLQHRGISAIAIVTIQSAWGTVPESTRPTFKAESPTVNVFFAQATPNPELLAAMKDLQALLEKSLATPEANLTPELSQGSDRLQSFLQNLLKSPSLEVTSDLRQESEELQSAIARRLEREDINHLTPEVRQKLRLLDRLLGALFSNNELSLSQDIIEGSPVLQRWREEIPNVLEEIHRDPAFRTRLRLGYSQFPSTDNKGGFNVGVEDISIARTGLTLSANYDRVFEGDRSTFGVDLNYYLLPLGSYVNVAPVVGYRNITTGPYETDGVAVGGKIIFPLSRTGAADLTFSQLFVSPGSADEVGISTLSAGYAVTPHLRISTDIQKQNSLGEKDSRVGIVLEWMP
jgi:hypothetical protein